MKFVTMTQLKNATSKVVREAGQGRSVVVMRHGRPCAALIRISADELDQLLFEESPLVRQALEEALGDLKHRRAVTLKDYLRGRRSS